MGALRPLKFARHLPQHGWKPIVVADLRPGDARDPTLLRALPADLEIHRTYSRVAEREAREGRIEHAPKSDDGTGRRWWDRWWPRALTRPDLLPLGEYALDIPQAYVAGMKVLREHPECQAIVVNADPYEAMLVGQALSRASGRPLILDLRDPWSVCEVRRPGRPAPVRWMVDRLERSVVEAASAVILNTETALRDYRRHYADLDSHRFHALRNHSDPFLIRHGQTLRLDPFSLLYLGTFRRFVGAEVWLGVLQALQHRGIGPHRVQLVVAGSIPPETKALAREMGVEAYVRQHPHVPYREIASLMNASGALVAMSHATAQRIPAKIYDYLQSERPIIVASSNPELRDIVEGNGAGRVIDPGKPEALARAVVDAMAGRLRRTDPSRAWAEFGSDRASKRLAEILDAACSSTRDAQRSAGRPSEASASVRR